VTEMAKKSLFYDFLARYGGTDFETYMAASEPDEDYLNWNGYALPYVFTQEELEYAAVRQGCALFDATPANKYRIFGAGAGALLDYMTTRAMSALPAMRATYAIWCNPDGMLNDDAMLFKRGDDNYLLMAAEVDHMDYLTELSGRFADVSVVEESALWAGLAVQGARSCAALVAIGFAGLQQLRPYEIGAFELQGQPVMVARVGFTGDLGYEIWFDRGLAPAVEQAFVQAEKTLGLRIAGYGLTTIQLCRMEAGMIVPGWDTAQTFEDPEAERSPFELGLAWNVDLDRDGDFVGRQALAEERARGSRFALKGFEVDAECELLDGTELFASIDGEDVQVGTLPSVSWSHGRAGWIGLASLRSEHVEVTDCFVVVDDEQVSCRIVGLPFVQIPGRRQVPAPL
jgi:aminomethyltransferase